MSCQASISLIVASLSVVVAFLFRISTEETATFSPKSLKSRITFGSQPIRNRVQPGPLQSTTLVGVETTTTIKLDDLGTHSKGVGEYTDASDAEARMLAKPNLLPDT